MPVALVQGFLDIAPAYHVPASRHCLEVRFLQKVTQERQLRREPLAVLREERGVSEDLRICAVIGAEEASARSLEVAYGSGHVLLAARHRVVELGCDAEVARELVILVYEAVVCLLCSYEYYLRQERDRGGPDGAEHLSGNVVGRERALGHLKIALERLPEAFVPCHLLRVHDQESSCSPLVRSDFDR